MISQSFQVLENSEQQISELKKTRNQLFNIPHKHFNWKEYYSISQIRKHKDLQERFNLPEDDLKTIVKSFIKWSKKPTYLMFQNKETGSLKGGLASKRGNKIYEYMLNIKLEEQLKFMKDKNFHKVILRNKEGFRNKKVSNTLFITLTCDPKKYNNNKTTAWLSFEHDYNIFITRLRKKYGKCWVMKSTESTQKGFPHIHLLVITEKEADVFPYRNKKGFIEYRLQEKEELEKYWSSIIDVVIPNPSEMKKDGCVSFMKDYIFKDMLKAYKYKDEREYKNYLTLALGWIFNKRCYSISGKNLTLDLITDTSITQTQIKEELLKLGEKEWIFLGFLDLKVNSGLSPPISIEIEFNNPNYDKFLNGIYKVNRKEQIEVYDIQNNPQISEENKKRIKEIMELNLVDWRDLVINKFNVEKDNPIFSDCNNKYSKGYSKYQSKIHNEKGLNYVLENIKKIRGDYLKKIF